MSLRHWIVFFLSTMFVSAVGIWSEPGNIPLGSVYVLGFLVAVFGLVATSLAPLVRPALVDRQEGYTTPAPARPGGLSPGGFPGINASFWSKIRAAQGTMAPLPAGTGPAPALAAAPAHLQDPSGKP